MLDAPESLTRPVFIVFLLVLESVDDVQRRIIDVEVPRNQQVGCVLRREARQNLLLAVRDLGTEEQRCSWILPVDVRLLCSDFP